MSSKKPFIIGNWKANKDKEECTKWLFEWRSLPKLSGVNVVVCPPYPLISFFENTDIFPAAQDVSTKGAGAFTGEVSAKNLGGMVKYCLVGHSERKLYFGEKRQDVNKKISHLRSYGITPVICFESRDELLQTSFKDGRAILVYEPSANISGGKSFKTLDVKSLMDDLTSIRQTLSAEYPLLYGGSVSRDNVADIRGIGILNGILPGQASLDAGHFYDLAKAWE